MTANQSGNPLLRLLRRFRLPVAMLAIMWVIQVFQAVTGMEMGYLGVLPRTLTGLWGVLLAPFIHADFNHLISNTLPFAVLSGLMVLFYPKVASPAFWMIYFLEGLLVWLFSRPSYHVGASGVVYGMLAFVFWTGIFRRNIKSIALAVLVLFYYGSMFTGILPGREGISWESHLLGAVAGIVVAFVWKGRGEEDEELPPSEKEEASRYYFDRDIFDQPGNQG